MTNSRRLILENDRFKAGFSAKGAELQSVYDKKNHKEILWNGDANFWGRHSPILFPIVGKLWNNSLKVDGKRYEMTQHGFARDAKWEVESTSEYSIDFKLQSSSKTHEVFPFDFIIRVNYQLIKSGVQTKITVTNPSEKTLPFSLGAHPAFFIPWESDSKLEDYELTFEKPEKVGLIKLSDKGYRSITKQSFLNNETTFQLSDVLFKDDALIFDDLQSNSLKISSKSSKYSLKFSWENYPHFGIWKPLKAPFICLEPWQGMLDEDDYEGEFKDRFGVINLQPKKNHSFSWQVELV